MVNNATRTIGKPLTAHNRAEAVSSKANVAKKSDKVSEPVVEETEKIEEPKTQPKKTTAKKTTKK